MRVRQKQNKQLQFHGKLNVYIFLEYLYLEESTHNDISISLAIGLSRKQPHAEFSLACSMRKISSP